MRIKKILCGLLAGVMLLGSAAGAESVNDIIDANVNRMKAMLNTPDFQVYYKAPGVTRAYYGAKFEPARGVYIGTPKGREIEGVSNAIDTYYITFDTAMTNAAVSRQSYPQQAPTGRLLAYNWNFAKQSIQPAEYDNYIKNTVDEMAASGNDVLLIFGKEMNTDDNFPNPEDFLRVYRYIAEYAKTKENIAMVWAPNDTGSLDHYLQDYYPGDQYVDWVGMSLYTVPYFQGIRDHGNLTESNNIAFVTGEYANSVMRAKTIMDFLDQNNIQKPVMITESGVGFQVTATGEDFTDWSVMQLKLLYSELPRVFPRLKIIVGFNNTVEGDKYRYDIGSNPTLKTVLEEQIADPFFLGTYPDCAAYSYIPVQDGLQVTADTEISAFAYVPKQQYVRVKYFIDGTEAYQSDYPPYTFRPGVLADGMHTLKAQMCIGDSVQDEKQFAFQYTTPVTVLMNGSPAAFDQPPVIVDGRALVPVRAVFEALGAEMEWDGATQTASAVKGDVQIKIKIGQASFEKNGQPIALDVPAQIVGDRTLIPLRAVADAFGCKVGWNGETKTATVDY